MRRQDQFGSTGGSPGRGAVHRLCAATGALAWGYADRSTKAAPAMAGMGRVSRRSCPLARAVGGSSVERKCAHSVRGFSARARSGRRVAGGRGSAGSVVDADDRRSAACVQRSRGRGGQSARQRGVRRAGVPSGRVGWADGHQPTTSFCVSAGRRRDSRHRPRHWGVSGAYATRDSSLVRARTVRRKSA